MKTSLQLCYCIVLHIYNDFGFERRILQCFKWTVAVGSSDNAISMLDSHVLANRLKQKLIKQYRRSS